MAYIYTVSYRVSRVVTCRHSEMPPKASTHKKAVAKAQAKVIEDKTFGLKNKSKSKKVQAYVADVTRQAKGMGARAAALPCGGVDVCLKLRSVCALCLLCGCVAHIFVPPPPPCASCVRACVCRVAFVVP